MTNESVKELKSGQLIKSTLVGGIFVVLGDCSEKEIQTEFYTYHVDNFFKKVYCVTNKSLYVVTKTTAQFFNFIEYKG